MWIDEYPDGIRYHRFAPPSQEVYYFKLLSDLHFGASGLNRRHLKADLDDAVERNARILINGDVFDGILPKDAKRYTPSVVAKELRGKDALINDTIDYAAEILQPYAGHIDLIGEGNHETAIRKWHSIDLIRLLIDRMSTPEHKIANGGYTGYVDYKVGRGKGTRSAFNVFYHHGSGGAAPVTGAAIKLYRRAVYVEDADIIWIGHVHDKMTRSIVKVRPACNTQNIAFREVRLVSTSAYLDYQRDSYAVERGYAPGAHGGALIKVWLERSRGGGEDRIKLRHKIEL